MNISYDWLRQYVACDLAPEALAERLTMAGLEVDAVEEIGSPLDGVLVGRVEAVRPHPNADRLVLCDVDLGPEHHADGRPVQIACGAPNVEAGQKVPVATPGATLRLPDRDDPGRRQPVTIEETTLRGEASSGMICSESELGLSADHSGIMVLAGDAETGSSLADYLSARGVAARDAVFDIELTPNRPDAASHIGVARDVAALTGVALCRPAPDLPTPGGEAANAVTVDIQAPDECPRYVGLLVQGVEVHESPAWLKRRLTAIGLRPRNNVVDVTNYVLHECGQPLHAFDFDEISGRKIIVRQAENDENITTLDGAERALPEGALLICDAERPVAIAGVMGGAGSEVTGETSSVLIESAYFAPSSVRRTAGALGLSTDASYRFERGMDPSGQVWAAARAAELLAEVAGAEVVPGVVDAHPQPYAPRTAALRPARANRLLGLDLSSDEMAALLEAIGFAVEEDEVALHCTVPSFRPDVEREVDLIEEIARLHGYDRIPTPGRTVVPATLPHEAPADAVRRAVRRRLSGIGFREVYTNSLLPEDVAARFQRPVPDDDEGGIVQTLKPISEAMAALRPSLLPGLLQVMAHNTSHGRRALRLFELGHVFRRTERDDTLIPGFAEHESLLAAMTGPLAEAGWDTAEREADFFDLKGVAEMLLEALRVPNPRIVPAAEPLPRMAYHAVAYAGDVRLGLLGRLAGDVAAGYDLDAPVFFAELDVHALVMLTEQQEHRYRPASRFPTVERDLAVLVDRDQPAGPLLDVIRAEGRPLLRHVSVFDLYTGEGIPEGKKSIAFGLRFGADRTLTDAEVDAQIEIVTGALRNRFDAALRR